MIPDEALAKYPPIYLITTGYSLSDQNILSPINPKCDDLLSIRIIKIYTNCSEIQNLQNLWFKFQNNLCKSD